MGARMQERATGEARRDGSAARWPGASGAFALFAEVLWVGILVAVCGVFLVTLPAALAAGSRHLQRYLAAEQASVRLFLTDFRAALAGSLVVGGVGILAVVLLLLDLALASAGLPGGAIVFAGGVCGLAVVGVVLLRASVLWQPSTGWRAALPGALRSLARDLVGALYLVVALALVVLLTWQLVPLVVPALGCLVFASVSVTERRRARDELSAS